MKFSLVEGCLGIATLFFRREPQSAVQLRQPLLQRLDISWISRLKLAEIFFVDVGDAP